MTHEQVTLYDVWEAIGEMKSVARSLTAEVTLIRQAVQEHGLIFGQLSERCDLRGRTCMHQMREDRKRIHKQSEEIGRLRDTSQVIHVEQVRTKTVAWTIVQVVGGIIALAGLAGVVWKIIGYVTGG